MTAPLYAAIDCGTNSTRLLISDGETTVTRLMTITRLGAGVDATGRLDPGAIARTLDVLEGDASLIDTHEVQHTRVWRRPLLLVTPPIERTSWSRPANCWASTPSC